jgi:hypothetical protein
MAVSVQLQSGESHAHVTGKTRSFPVRAADVLPEAMRTRRPIPGPGPGARSRDGLQPMGEGTGRSTESTESTLQCFQPMIESMYGVGAAGRWPLAAWRTRVLGAPSDHGLWIGRLCRRDWCPIRRDCFRGRCEWYRSRIGRSRSLPSSHGASSGHESGRLPPRARAAGRPLGVRSSRRRTRQQGGGRAARPRSRSSRSSRRRMCRRRLSTTSCCSGRRPERAPPRRTQGRARCLLRPIASIKMAGPRAVVTVFPLSVQYGQGSHLELHLLAVCTWYGAPPTPQIMCT